MVPTENGTVAYLRSVFSHAGDSTVVESPTYAWVEVVQPILSISQECKPSVGDAGDLINCKITLTQMNEWVRT